MQVIRTNQCDQIVAGDNSRLREILHPARTQGFDGRYSLAYAEVEVGRSTLKHRLIRASEVYFILRGRGEMHVGTEYAPVGPGDTVVIPPGSVQWITNVGTETLAFLCLVDPAWSVEDEQVLD
jgi:mannose-6-phosphate isomerase-like protein (cupin superfamily)